MAEQNRPYSLRQLLIYFLQLGSIGFGGPVALTGFMKRDLVEKKNWITEEDFKEGLALAQLAPGPLAAQLAIYLGYIDFGILGATLVGICFVLPSFLMVLALGFFYVRAGGLPWMRDVFYGIAPAVVGIIFISSYRLATKTLKKDWLLWGFFLIMAGLTFILEKELLAVMLACGIIAWFIKSPPRFRHTLNSLFLLPCILLQAAQYAMKDEKMLRLGWFFFKAGAFVFGSGLAIVPFLYGGLVKELQWLNEREFLDAVAVAMITPGPVVITAGFIGYLVAGLPGACVATLSTFLPCYLLTISLAPVFKKYGKNKAVKAFVDGITSATIGAITAAAILLAKKQVYDLTSLLIAAGTIVVLLTLKKVKEPYIILIAAIIGCIVRKY